MLNEQKFLAVITARGGSKRCPRKNIRLFQGKPLIQWAYDAAIHSHYLDRVVLSTEDAEIKSVAESFGCPVIDRPEELATDSAMNEDVLRHVLTIEKEYDFVVLLQPTSPLRVANDINRLIELDNSEV